MIVHGFGVAHAHFVVLPLEHPWDITAAQFSYIEDGAVKFLWDKVELAPRAELDVTAERLRRELGSVT